jgi:hypothetical protein
MAFPLVLLALGAGALYLAVKGSAKPAVAPATGGIATIPTGSKPVPSVPTVLNVPTIPQVSMPTIPNGSCNTAGELQEPLKSAVDAAVAGATDPVLLDTLASSLDAMQPPCGAVSARVRIKAALLRTQGWFSNNPSGLAPGSSPGPIPASTNMVDGTQYSIPPAYEVLYRSKSDDNTGTVSQKFAGTPLGSDAVASINPGLVDANGNFTTDWIRIPTSWNIFVKGDLSGYTGGVPLPSLPAGSATNTNAAADLSVGNVVSST